MKQCDLALDNYMKRQKKTEVSELMEINFSTVLAEKFTQLKLQDNDFGSRLIRFVFDGTHKTILEQSKRNKRSKDF